MEKIRALISKYARVDKKLVNDHLKLCFLWYDEVLIETFAEGEHCDNFFEKIITKANLNRKESQLLTDIIVPISQKVPKETLRDFYSSHQAVGYPRWGKNQENYTYPEPETSAEYAHNKVLGHLQTTMGMQKFSGHDVLMAEGGARSAVDSVCFWKCVQKELNCMLQTTEIEKVALQSYQEFNNGNQQHTDPSKLFEANIPSLLEVSWKEIIKIKSENNFRTLREIFSQVLNKAPNDFILAQKYFTEIEEETKNEIFERHRPNFKKVIFEAITANIPGLLFNPVSLFYGVRDIGKEISNAKNTNWIYLLYDIKKTSQMHS